jgi:hypothetical protein
MAKRSEQVRKVALSVCHRLDLFEVRVAQNVPSSPAAGAVSTGLAGSRGTGSSLTAVAGEVPLSVLIDRAGNDVLQALLTDAARVRSEFDAILAAGAGVIAKRSERALGYSGYRHRRSGRARGERV